MPTASPSWSLCADSSARACSPMNAAEGAWAGSARGVGGGGGGVAGRHSRATAGCGGSQISACCGMLSACSTGKMGAGSGLVSSTNASASLQCVLVKACRAPAGEGQSTAVGRCCQAAGPGVLRPRPPRVSCLRQCSLGAFRSLAPMGHSQAQCRRSRRQPAGRGRRLAWGHRHHVTGAHRALQPLPPHQQHSVQ